MWQPLDALSSHSDRVTQPLKIAWYFPEWGLKMTPTGPATGPMPALRVPSSDDRLALLDKMGARQSDRFTRYRFPTADAIIDPIKGVLWIAVDIDPDPADWSAVVGLIRAVGFTDGALPHRRDPGEPELDPLSAVYTWRLEYVERPQEQVA